MAHNMANLSQQPAAAATASAAACQPHQSQQQMAYANPESKVYVSKDIKKSFDAMFKVVQNDPNPNLKSKMINGVPWRQRNMPKSFFEPPTSSSASSAAHSRDSSADSSKVNSKPPTPTTGSTVMMANSPPSTNNHNNGPLLLASSMSSSPHRTSHCTPPPGLPQVVHQKAFSCPETTHCEYSMQNSALPINVNGHHKPGCAGQMIGSNQDLILQQQQQQQQQQSLQQLEAKNHNRQQSYDINKIPLPDDWEMDFEPRTGERFFLNHKLKITQWDDPRMIKRNNHNNNNNNHHHQLSFMTQSLSHSNPLMNIHQQQQRIVQQPPSMVMFSSQPNIHTCPPIINSQPPQPQMDQSPCNLRQRQQIGGGFHLNNPQLQQPQQLPTACGNNNNNNPTTSSTILSTGEYITMIDPNGNIPVESVSAMENLDPLGSPNNNNNNSSNIANGLPPPPSTNLQQTLLFESNIRDYEMEIKSMRERQESLLKMPGMKSDYKPPLQQTSEDPFLTNSREMINNNNSTIISDQIDHVRQTSQDSGLGSTGYPNTLESCPFNNVADFINDFGLQRQNNLSNGIGGDLHAFDGVTENIPDLESIEFDDLMNSPNYNDLLQISHDETMTWHV